jgi:hypothetical protein
MSEPILVSPSIAKPRRGALTTLEKRRKAHKNSTVVKGKVAGKRDHYSDKEKTNAVCVFAVTGNSRRTAELTKIPEATIRAWKMTEWWHEIANRIIVEQDEELNTKLTALVDKAVAEVNDRLEEGNYVYNPKLDKLVRKKLDAKELASVTATFLDKRQLLRGLPTSRVERVSQDERLLKLSEQFKQFAKAKEVKQVEEKETLATVVDEWEIDEVDGPTINELFGEVD